MITTEEYKMETKVSLVVQICPHCNEKAEASHLKMEDREHLFQELHSEKSGKSPRFTSPLIKNGISTCPSCDRSYAYRYKTEEIVVCDTGKINWN
jgi:hypothetical protein